MRRARRPAPRPGPPRRQQASSPSPATWTRLCGSSPRCAPPLTFLQPPPSRQAARRTNATSGRRPPRRPAVGVASARPAAVQQAALPLPPFPLEAYLRSKKVMAALNSHAPIYELHIGAPYLRSKKVMAAAPPRPPPGPCPNRSAASPCASLRPALQTPLPTRRPFVLHSRRCSSPTHRSTTTPSSPTSCSPSP